MILSIIIVNYNVKHFLQQCLQSVYKSIGDLGVEIIVVDNNSVDKSIEMLREHFPKLKLIINDKNVGFAKANNQAIKQAKGNYILLLNPDTVIQEDTLIKTISFLEQNKKAGALGVKMLDGNGLFLPESKRSLPSPASAFYKIFGLSKLFPNSKTFGQYHLNYLNNNEVHEVDVLSGAFFMTRKKILDEIGLLDERFFMYGEDIDLSYRIQKMGYKNYYVPITSIIHYKGESTKKTSVNYIITFYKAMILFVKKHYKQQNANPLIFLIQLAILLRASISLLKRFTLKITYPIIDGIIIFFGLLVIKTIWAKTYFLNENYYSDLFLKFGIPSYITFWIIGIYIQKGYEVPVKIANLVKGIISGTIFLLIIYGLLPEQLRFSRALILFGTIWTLITTYITRKLFNLLNIDNLKIKSTRPKRIAIISNKMEFQRIQKIIKTTNANAEDVYQIEIIKKSNLNKNNHLGHISQLEEIIKIHKIDEIIFSAKDITSNEIIRYMEKITNNIEIKIAPTESTFVIGSNSIHTQGNLYILNNRQQKKNPIITYFKKYIDFFN